MKRRIALLGLALGMTISGFCRTPGQDSIPAKLQWFADAKLGIFIHWGIYSVYGIDESWSFYNKKISYANYMKQCEGFTASKYDPEAWARLFSQSGARYAILTSKHHDGFALWDTHCSDLSAVKKSPAKRDLIGPYCKAMRQEGLKVGLYFSHLDWSHPDYASIRPASQKNTPNMNPFGYPPVGKENPQAWNRFLQFHRCQINELLTRYHPDLWWFDGDWERDADQWNMKELREEILSQDPNTILNSRMCGYGDYATPEQGVPVTPPEGLWELCMTMNDSWGYQGRDTNFKSVDYIIRIFSECVGMGGNLLLDIGPKADGTIPQPEVERLEELGIWTHKNAEGIYGTTAGLPCGHFYGPTTLSKDKKTLYLFQFDIPRSSITVKGIRNPIRNIRVLGSGDKVQWKKTGGAAWKNIPGVLEITIPPSALDPHCTVVAIDLEEPLDLYSGQGL